MLAKLFSWLGTREGRFQRVRTGPRFGLQNQSRHQTGVNIQRVWCDGALNQCMPMRCNCHIALPGWCLQLALLACVGIQNVTDHFCVGVEGSHMHPGGGTLLGQLGATTVTSYA